VPHQTNPRDGPAAARTWDGAAAGRTGGMTQPGAGARRGFLFGVVRAASYRSVRACWRDNLVRPGKAGRRCCRGGVDRGDPAARRAGRYQRGARSAFGEVTRDGALRQALSDPLNEAGCAWMDRAAGFRGATGPRCRRMCSACWVRPGHRASGSTSCERGGRCGLRDVRFGYRGRAGRAARHSKKHWTSRPGEGGFAVVGTYRRGRQVKLGPDGWPGEPAGQRFRP